ncbi:HlyD family efflux transporter periplasmic adaptor subunit [Microbacterium sp. EST19A]|uniref:HlyD family efflux transporter periplasmic adaptor subunit n=1 Tax=Microbacterium sp. EST19A TaxID=2862681 RepID=UPI001CBBCA87|nr:HlyD family efflux transporter periplasmic adaptor subunit [Microbacterium sp. EST19A]
MSSPVYRASAMGHLSSPEQLDTEVRLVRPAGWIALGAVGLVLAGFVAWCFLGTVQTTVPAAGVLTTPSGSSNSLSPEEGIVSEMLVSQGDQVSQGDPVAVIATATGEVTVPASASGEVVEMLAYPTDAVLAGGTVVSIQPEDELRSYLFIPVAESQPIRPGMTVQIAVTTVAPEDYGLLLGTVTRVGTHPATRAGVGALLNNDDITNIVVGGVPVFQIEVALTPAETPSGYAWTSGAGPSEELSAGTLVNSTVTIATQTPITLLFPSDRAGG